MSPVLYPLNMLLLESCNNLINRYNFDEATTRYAYQSRSFVEGAQIGTCYISAYSFEFNWEYIAGGHLAQILNFILFIKKFIN